MNKKVVLFGILILIIQIFFGLNANITGNVISTSNEEFSWFLIIQLTLSCALIIFGLFNCVA